MLSKEALGSGKGESKDAEGWARVPQPPGEGQGGLFSGGLWVLDCFPGCPCSGLRADWSRRVSAFEEGVGHRGSKHRAL